MGIVRALTACSSFSVAVALVVGTGSGAVRAEAAIEVSVTPTSEPTFVFEKRSFDVVVSNPGTEPLSSVVVTARPEGPAYPPAVLTDRVVVAGNDDDVLDPGEQWSFEAAVPAGESNEFDVTAVAPDDSEVTAFFVGFGLGHPTDLTYPVELSVVSEVTSALAGDHVRWTVSGTNIATFPIVGIEAEWRLLYPDWSAPIEFTPLDAATERGDGDDVLSPDETWWWEIDQTVMLDGSFLQVRLGAERGDLEPGFRLGLEQESAAIAVEPPSITPSPTTPAATTPATDLPRTGFEATLAVVALSLLLVGAVALRVARTS